jgi:hypothetical protein
MPLKYLIPLLIQGSTADKEANYLSFNETNHYKMSDIIKDLLLVGLPLDHTRYICKDTDSDQYFLFVFTEVKGLLISSINAKSITAFQDLLKIEISGLSNKESQPILLKFFQLVADSRSDFKVLEDYQEVYWKFCIIQGNHSILTDKMQGIPTRPLRSAELLKRWFDFTLSIKLSNEFDAMMDQREETKLRFTSDFIENEIAFAARMLDSVTNDKLKKSHFPETEMQIIRRKETKIALTAYRDWLENRLGNGKNSDSNLNARIFTESKGFLILKEWFKDYDKKKELTEASFILRKLILDGLIYEDVKQQTLIDLVGESFDVSIDRVKTLDDVENHSRNSRFRLIKKQFN